ncbi:hypothetical protein ABIF65_007741 [Bradyrhizobium japonicum]|uniref:hypothetical protein n=1 Tax=Bradyrhizobium TaxID=374 RepID=UPI001BA474B3|nr:MULTISPECIES: hypothetical protein [Bradyrhizobium]MBR0881226.1 hypothetical protein [Bradyrhizobium liaoningense]MBR1067429.1 hypothetical protein [Bradyrhizobium liaoningense]MCP1775112.1 hypothetical protein [Bradyrhizobium japonicum]MCP1961887.1 hypothetical protein [Bradyrhizobium japonicum]
MKFAARTNLRRVALAGSRLKVPFADKDRDAVQGVKTRTTERQATGIAAKVVRSERLPDGVEFEKFPETVNREAHSLRECQTSIARAQVPLVDPAERTVIEEISTNLSPRAKNGPAAAKARP